MPRKMTFCVGSRIKHKTDDRLSEGVIVFVDEGKEKLYSIHWNNKCISRGVYLESEIQKINTSSTLIRIRKEIEESEYVN